MDMTCSCPAFPFCIRRIHHHLSISFVVIFTVLVSFTQCVQLFPAWDFAVTHGQQIVLSADGARQVLSIPPPLSNIDHWQNQLQNSTNYNSIDTLTKATELWKHQTFKKLEFDPKRGLFFIVSSPWNLQSIVVFNTTSNQTHSLLTKDSSAAIGGIVYHNGSLYWTNRTSNSIWKMNVSGDEITSWTPAKDFYKPANSKLRELAIDAKTNTLFFINLVRGGGYEIQYFNCLNLTINGVVTESSDELLALTTDDSFLYWVEGSDKFYIQRIPLSNLSKETGKEIIQEGKSQLISTMSVACSKNYSTKSLFWSTCNSKTVWQKDNFTINSKEAHHQQQRPNGLHFGSSCPQGIISRNFAFKDWSLCTENSSSSSRLRSVTNPPVPLNIKTKTTTSTILTPTTTTTIVTTTSRKSSITGQTASITQSTTSTTSTARSTLTSATIVAVPLVPSDSENNDTFVKHSSSSPSASSSYHFTASTANIIFVVVCSSLLIIIVILMSAVVYLYRKVQKLQRKPRIRRVIVSRSSRQPTDASIPSMCELVDIENCCNMNECETPCYERLGSESSNQSSIHNEYKTKGKSRTEDKERLIDT